MDLHRSRGPRRAFTEQVIFDYSTTTEARIEEVKINNLHYHQQKHKQQQPHMLDSYSSSTIAATAVVMSDNDTFIGCSSISPSPSSLSVPTTAAFVPKTPTRRSLFGGLAAGFRRNSSRSAYYHVFANNDETNMMLSEFEFQDDPRLEGALVEIQNRTERHVKTIVFDPEEFRLLQQHLRDQCYTTDFAIQENIHAIVREQQRNKRARAATVAAEAAAQEMEQQMRKTQNIRIHHKTESSNTTLVPGMSIYESEFSPPQQTLTTTTTAKATTISTRVMNVVDNSGSSSSPKSVVNFVTILEEEDEDESSTLVSPASPSSRSSVRSETALYSH